MERQRGNQKQNINWGRGEQGEVGNMGRGSKHLRSLEKLYGNLLL